MKTMLIVTVSIYIGLNIGLMMGCMVHRKGRGCNLHAALVGIFMIILIVVIAS